MGAACEVFISYAHADEKLCRELTKHLAPLKREGWISSWRDREIPAGAEWSSEITTRLGAARLVLLLISADFVDSDYVWHKEMPVALARHRRGEAVVIPVLLRPLADWTTAELGRLQALPTDGRPVTAWPDHDKAFKDVAEGIRRVVENLRAGSETRPSSLAGVTKSRAARIFVGRDSELERLEGLLLGDASCLPVAIEGMAGVGKSYLADRFARLHADAFPGGYEKLVLDVRSPRKAEEMLADLADRFGLGSPAPAEALIRRLRSPRTLLHVENADSDPAHRAAVAVADRLPGCALVVSGRLQDLGRSRGWERIEIEPLSEDLALEQLWLELEEDPWDAERREQHRRLVEALGHLPLAIYLAAGHLRAGRTPDGFLERLHRRGLRIKPVDHGALEGTEEVRLLLRETFEISRKLAASELRESEEDSAESLLGGLRALGHAPLNGWGRSLGAAIAGLSGDDFENLAVVATKLRLWLRLPRSERKPRMWRIHPLVAELLREGTPEAPVVACMTKWFLARLPEGKASEEQERGRRWRAAQIESRALTWWLARVPVAKEGKVLREAQPYAWRNGPYVSWMELCEKVLRREELVDDIRSDALWVLCQVAYWGGYLDRALEVARQKIDFEQRRHCEHRAALAWRLIADIHYRRDDFEVALSTLRQEALPVFEKLGDARECAATHGEIADILRKQGELDEALGILEEKVLATFDQPSAARDRAVALGKIADIIRRQGNRELDFTRRRELLEKALRIRQQDEVPVYERLGEVREGALAHEKAADMIAELGDPDEAIRIYSEEVLPAYESLGSLYDFVHWGRDLAKIHLDRGQPGDRDRAADLLCRALSYADRLRIPEAGKIRKLLADHRLDPPAASTAGGLECEPVTTSGVTR